MPRGAAPQGHYGVLVEAPEAALLASMDAMVELMFCDALALVAA